MALNVFRKLFGFTDEAKLKKVSFLYFSLADSRISRRGLKNYSREQIRTLVRSMGGQTLLPVEDLPSGWEEWTEDELVREVEKKLEPLEDVQIDDGGTYLVVFLVTNLTEQLKALARWQESVTLSFEASAAERAVQRLREAGHTDVKRFCAGKRVKRPKGDNVVVEIDAGATAENCGIVVECKAVLDADAAKQLKEALKKISTLAEEGVEAVAQFKSKRLYGALCGLRVTLNQNNRRELVKLCKENGFEIWLPNGADLGTGDGCFQSPSVVPPSPQSGSAAGSPKSPSASLVPLSTQARQSRLRSAVGPGTFKPRSFVLKPLLGSSSSLQKDHRLLARLPCAMRNLQVRPAAAYIM